jgi:hypothetical protein
MTLTLSSFPPASEVLLPTPLPVRRPRYHVPLFFQRGPQPEASETSMTWEFPHLPCSILLAQAGTDDVGVPAPQGTWPGLGATAAPLLPPEHFHPTLAACGLN